MIATFRFKPFSRKQRQILNWWCRDSPVNDYDGIIADGAIRSGKTVSMSLPLDCGQWRTLPAITSSWQEKQSVHLDEMCCAFGRL